MFGLVNLLRLLKVYGPSACMYKRVTVLGLCVCLSVGQDYRISLDNSHRVLFFARYGAAGTI